MDLRVSGENYVRTTLMSDAIIPGSLGQMLLRLQLPDLTYYLISLALPRTSLSKVGVRICVWFDPKKFDQCD